MFFTFSLGVSHKEFLRIGQHQNLIMCMMLWLSSITLRPGVQEGVDRHKVPHGRQLLAADLQKDQVHQEPPPDVMATAPEVGGGNKGLAKCQQL